MQITQETLARLRTTAQFLQEYTAFTKGSLRNILFNRGLNGLTEMGAVVQLGKKILIDPARFMEWVQSGRSITGR